MLHQKEPNSNFRGVDEALFGNSGLNLPFRSLESRLGTPPAPFFYFLRSQWRIIGGV